MNVQGRQVSTTTTNKITLKATCAGCSKAMLAASATERCPGCGGLLFIEEDRLPDGLIIDNSYEIIAKIGVGSWGVVYKARQISVNRDVAIKVLHKHHLAKARKSDRFLQEANALKRLHHEGLAAVYDVGTLDTGEPYLVQEFVSGISLREWLDEKRPVNGALFKGLFGQILDVLAEVHAKGIIHRDIKPANIMIDVDGEKTVVKVLDFGIAKLIDDDQAVSLTATGDLLGTPLYMSPEQCLGQKLDGRADLYAIGCIMHEFLSGTSPFLSENGFQCMMKHLQEDAPDLSEFGVNDAYRHVIEHALLKDPQRRFQNAFEFARAVSHLPDVVEGVGSARTTKKAPKRLPMGMIGIVAGVFIVVGFLCTAICSKSGKPPQSMQRPVNPVPAAAPPSGVDDLIQEERADMATHELGSAMMTIYPPDSSVSTATLEKLRAAAILYNDKSDGATQSRTCYATFDGLGKKVGATRLINSTVIDLASVGATADGRRSTEYAISPDYKLYWVNARGDLSKVEIPSTLPQQITGIAAGAAGSEQLYALSSCLLRYNQSTNQWSRLAQFPSGGSGLAYLPQDKAIVIFGRTNSTPGHLNTLYFFGQDGKLQRKIALSQALVTNDGAERVVQLRVAGSSLIAIVPQPGGANPVEVVIDPKTGRVQSCRQLFSHS